MEQNDEFVQSLAEAKKKYGYDGLRRALVQSIIPPKLEETDSARAKGICDALQSQKIITDEEYVPLFETLIVTMKRYKNLQTGNIASGVASALQATRLANLDVMGHDSDYMNKRATIRKWCERVMESLEGRGSVNESHVALVLSALEVLVNRDYDRVEFERKGGDLYIRLEAYYGTGSSLELNLTRALTEIIKVSDLTASKRSEALAGSLVSKHGSGLLMLLSKDLPSFRFRENSFLRQLLKTYSTMTTAHLPDRGEELVDKAMTVFPHDARVKIASDAYGSQKETETHDTQQATEEYNQEGALMFPQEHAIFETAVENITANLSPYVEAINLCERDVGKLEDSYGERATAHVWTKFSDVVGLGLGAPKLFSTPLVKMLRDGECLRTMQLSGKRDKILLSPSKTRQGARYDAGDKNAPKATLDDPMVNVGRMLVLFRKHVSQASDKLADSVQKIVGDSIRGEHVTLMPVFCANLKTYLIEHIGRVLRGQEIRFPMHLVTAQGGRGIIRPLSHRGGSLARGAVVRKKFRF